EHRHQDRKPSEHRAAIGLGECRRATAERAPHTEARRMCHAQLPWVVPAATCDAAGAWIGAGSPFLYFATASAMRSPLVVVSSWRAESAWVAILLVLARPK